MASINKLFWFIIHVNIEYIIYMGNDKRLKNVLQKYKINHKFCVSKPLRIIEIIVGIKAYNNAFKYILFIFIILKLKY